MEGGLWKRRLFGSLGKLFEFPTSPLWPNDDKLSCTEWT